MMHFFSSTMTMHSNDMTVHAAAEVECAHRHRLHHNIKSWCKLLDEVQAEAPVLTTCCSHTLSDGQPIGWRHGPHHFLNILLRLLPVVAHAVFFSWVPLMLLTARSGRGRQPVSL